MSAVTRLRLIAAREFNAYVATASFWIALLIGPLAMGGALALGSLAMPAPTPAMVAIRADDPQLAALAAASLAQASSIEQRPAPQIAKDAKAAIVLHRGPDGALAIRFDEPFPLSTAGRALLSASIERDDALRSLGRKVQPAPAAAPAPVKPALNIGDIGRFALVMMLWLTLTGSLGMLLQAVVRERTNRALETLLAAAQPWEIVFGKLAGVGGVSLLVLVSWLGSTGVTTAMAPGAGGALAPVFHMLGQPGLLAYAVAIYLLAFLLFGLVTVAVGAAAADTAAAQNLSRPMFTVLLAALFAALAAAGGASNSLSWLIYIPPFTPFMLLLKNQPVGVQITALSILAMAITTAGWVAVHGLSLKSTSRSWIPSAAKQSGAGSR